MKILNLILIFLPLISYSQQLKTYTGEYSLDGKSGFSDYGKATYKYYENDDSERIKEGSFSFQGRTMKVEGQFKNGLRNGLWKFTNTQTSKYASNIPNIIVVSATYIAGKLNGKCSYIKTAYPSKKILESSIAYFKNNLLIGDYVYIKYPESEYDKKLSIKYSQDSLGKLNGEYRAEFYQKCCNDLGNIEDVARYENGTMIYRLCREKINGKVYYKYENGSYSKEIDNYGSKDVFSSTWDAHIGADFWIGRDGQYCGTGYNPIYATTEGLDRNGFMFFYERKNLTGK